MDRDFIQNHNATFSLRLDSRMNPCNFTIALPLLINSAAKRTPAPREAVLPTTYSPAPVLSNTASRFALFAPFKIPNVIYAFSCGVSPTSSDFSYGVRPKSCG